MKKDEKKEERKQRDVNSSSKIKQPRQSSKDSRGDEKQQPQPQPQPQPNLSSKPPVAPTPPAVALLSEPVLESTSESSSLYCSREWLISLLPPEQKTGDSNILSCEVKSFENIMHKLFSEIKERPPGM